MAWSLGSIRLRARRLGSQLLENSGTYAFVRGVARRCWQRCSRCCCRRSCSRAGRRGTRDGAAGRRAAPAPPGRPAAPLARGAQAARRRPPPRDRRLVGAHARRRQQRRPAFDADRPRRLRAGALAQPRPPARAGPRVRLQDDGRRRLLGAALGDPRTRRASAAAPTSTSTSSESFAVAVARRYSGSYVIPRAVSRAAAPPLRPSQDAQYLAQQLRRRATRARAITLHVGARRAAGSAVRADTLLAPSLGTERPPPTRPLPKVDVFTIWNEPNHTAFLRPQWVNVNGKRWVPQLAARVPRDGRHVPTRRSRPCGPDSTILVGGTSVTGSYRNKRHGQRRRRCASCASSPASTGKLQADEAQRLRRLQAAARRRLVAPPVLDAHRARRAQPAQPARRRADRRAAAAGQGARPAGPARAAWRRATARSG